MKIQPMNEYIHVQPEPRETATKGGILIPETGRKAPNRGKVLAVGPGAVSMGRLVEPRVRVGDVVMFLPFGGDA